MDENKTVEWKFFEEEIMSLRGVMVPWMRETYTHIYIYITPLSQDIRKESWWSGIESRQNYIGDKLAKNGEVAYN